MVKYNIMIFTLIELTISSVGAYNIAKGLYNMYRDAEIIKQEYRNHKELTKQYKRAQQDGQPDVLTDSQYIRMEGQFQIIG